MEKTKETKLKINIKNNKGITLVALVITIAVMLVIAAATVDTSLGRFEINRYKKLMNDLELLEGKVQNYYLKYGGLPIVRYNNNDPVLFPIENLEFYKDSKDNSIYYILDLSTMDNLSLNYGNDFENYKDLSEVDFNKKDLYVINEGTHTIYYVEGVELSGEKYHYISTNNIIDDIIPPTSPRIVELEKYVDKIELEVIPGKDGWSGVEKLKIEIISKETGETAISQPIEIQNPASTNLKIDQYNIIINDDEDSKINIDFSGQYIIKAYTIDKKGNPSSVSNELEFSILGIDTPTLEIESQEQRKVVLSITKGDRVGTGFEKYEIEQIRKYGAETDENNTTTTLFETDQDKITFSETGIYKIRVRIIDTEGHKSLYSNEVNFEILKLDAPTLVVDQKATKTFVKIEEPENLGHGLDHYKITYTKAGATTTTTTSSNSIEFTEDATYSVKAYTVDKRGNTSSVSNTVNFTIKTLKIGDYIEYDVAYTDTIKYVFSSKEFTYNKTNGWRIISFTTNEDGTCKDVKLMSTGHPGCLYVGTYSGDTYKADWYVTDSTRLSSFRNVLGSGYEIYSTSDNNYRAAAGLYYNFESILFTKYSSNLNSMARHTGGFYNILTNGIEQTGTKTGQDLFKIRNDSKIRLLTLTELNLAIGRTDVDSTNLITKTTDLYKLEDLNLYSYGNQDMAYLLASPFPGYSLGIPGVYLNGTIALEIDNAWGVRPVIEMTSTDITFTLSDNGKYWIMN